jgi:hypothetical protein
MTAKITLYSEDKLIREVKKFAYEQNTSVSKLVNGFFQTLLAEEDTKSSKGKLTNFLLGSLKGVDVDESDYLQYREDKYL